MCKPRGGGKEVAVGAVRSRGKEEGGKIHREITIPLQARE